MNDTKLTGEIRYRFSLTGKVILQVEITWIVEDYQYLEHRVYKKWRDAKPSDFLNKGLGDIL